MDSSVRTISNEPSDEAVNNDLDAINCVIMNGKNNQCDILLTPEVTNILLDSSQQQETQLPKQSSTSKMNIEATNPNSQDADGYEDWSDDDDVDQNDELKAKVNILSKTVIVIQRGWSRLYTKAMGLSNGHFFTCINVLFYIIYVVCALIYEFGSEESIRLLVFSILMFIIAFRTYWLSWLKLCFGKIEISSITKKRIAFFIRILLYVALASVIIYCLVDEGRSKPDNMYCILGLAALLFIVVLFSKHPSKINWHTVYWSLGLQFLMAVAVLKWPTGRRCVLWLQARLDEFFANTQPASKMMFGDSYKDHQMVFSALPILLFTNAMITVLFYLGGIQFLVRVLGKALSFCLHTTPVESMAVAASIFLEGVVSMLIFRPYLKRCTKSQLFTILTSAQSSLGGAYLAMLAQLGISMEYLIPAMVISAPATFTICKLMWPESKSSDKSKEEETLAVADDEKKKYSSSFDAFQAGATAMLYILGDILVLSFSLFSFINWFNSTLTWFGDRVGIKNLTIELISSYVMYPLARMMGVAAQDCRSVAMLLGLRNVHNIVAIFKLKQLTAQRGVYYKYLAATGGNGTVSFSGDDVILDLWNRTLPGGFINERSEAIVTYSLCGFSSALAVVISLSVISTIIPLRKQWLIKTSVLTLIAGNVVNIMTGAFAGIFADV